MNCWALLLRRLAHGVVHHAHHVARHLLPRSWHAKAAVAAFIACLLGGQVVSVTKMANDPSPAPMPSVIQDPSDPHPVPEPNSLSMLLGPALAIAFLARRQ